MTNPMRRPAIILFAILALLALGWAYGAATNWDEIESRPARLAYLVADFALVIPLGIIAGIGVLRWRSWAYPLFAIAAGALLFDVAHGVFYLIWDNYFGVPWALALVLLLVALAYTTYVGLVLTRRERAVTTRGGGATRQSESAS